jgi:hypothetical protein
MIIQVKPVIDYSVRNLCFKPYPRHPKGCPNFGKRDTCPPKALYYDKVYDLTKHVYAIYNVFDFKEHVDKMKSKHPLWSENQLRCVLYWQGSARKSLKNKILEFLKENREYQVETCPEAMGVNVTETMKNVGIILEWFPENVAYQVALAGVLLNKGG